MSKLSKLLKPEIKECISILKEASSSGAAGWSANHPDDGPAVFYDSQDKYKQKIKDLVDIIGYKILSYHMEEDPDFDFDYRTNLVPVVSYGKSEKWKKHILKVGSQAGYKVLRGLSRKFGLDKDSVEAGTPEIYKKSAKKSLKKEDRNIKSYFHKI